MTTQCAASVGPRCVGARRPGPAPRSGPAPRGQITSPARPQPSGTGAAGQAQGRARRAGGPRRGEAKRGAMQPWHGWLRPARAASRASRRRHGAQRARRGGSRQDYLGCAAVRRARGAQACEQACSLLPRHRAGRGSRRGGGSMCWEWAARGGGGRGRSGCSWRSAWRKRRRQQENRPAGSPAARGAPRGPPVP